MRQRLIALPRPSYSGSFFWQKPVVLDSFGTSFNLMPSSNVSQTHETSDGTKGFLYFPTPG